MSVKPAVLPDSRFAAPERALGRAAPRLLVLSSLFPSPTQPGAGLFIRERMFRVGRHLPIVIVAPQPWFPFQSLIRWFRPHFRPMAPRFENQSGFDIYRPWFLCFPGVLKQLDGLLMALCSWPTVRRLVKQHRLNAIDAHFGFPDGRAATLLGRWLGLPVMITLRGKEERQARTSLRIPLANAIRAADRLVCVSEALRQCAIAAGAPPDKVAVIGNGVDITKFHRIAQTRRDLGIPQDAQVLITVGALIERKGFHRVIACLPSLLGEFPNLRYLVVGGGGPDGDMSSSLKRQVASLGLADRVHFLGPLAPERLKAAYSAADLFVLATSYEGWANVFLEAMACGLPVVTTLVGGNAEVVASSHLGELIEFGDETALAEAIRRALRKPWDRDAIVSYARSNGWDERIRALLGELEALVAMRGASEVVR